MKLSKTILLTLSLVAGVVGFSMASSLPAFADNEADTSTTTDISATTSTVTSICESSASETAKKAAGCSGTSSDFQTLLVTILNSIIGIVGLVAVIFVITGGVQYITSSGDAGKALKAKNTILYASIGIAICALAFAIVNWVISIIPS